MRCTAALQPVAHAVTFAVHVLSAAQICDAALPSASPAADEQRESTSPSSLPPAIAVPTQTEHALTAPAAVMARPFFERQNMFAAQSVVAAERMPVAEQVRKPLKPV